MRGHAAPESSNGRIWLGRMALVAVACIIAPITLVAAGCATLCVLAASLLALPVLVALKLLEVVSTKRQHGVSISLPQASTSAA